MSQLFSSLISNRNLFHDDIFDGVKSWIENDTNEKKYYPYMSFLDTVAVTGEEIEYYVEGLIEDAQNDMELTIYYELNGDGETEIFIEDSEDEVCDKIFQLCEETIDEVMFHIDIDLTSMINKLYIDDVIRNYLSAFENYNEDKKVVYDEDDLNIDELFAQRG